MREIKFRAWSKCGKYLDAVGIMEWTVGGLRASGAGVYFCGCNERPFGEKDLVDGDHIILEQFTGLKDKNGKEIYEGDIFVRWINDTPTVVEFVEYSDCCVSGMGFEGASGATEVIGNIHENPELLKK